MFPSWKTAWHRPNHDQTRGRRTARSTKPWTCCRARRGPPSGWIGPCQWMPRSPGLICTPQGRLVPERALQRVTSMSGPSRMIMLWAGLVGVGPHKRTRRSTATGGRFVWCWTPTGRGQPAVGHSDRRNSGTHPGSAAPPPGHPHRGQGLLAPVHLSAAPDRGIRAVIPERSDQIAHHTTKGGHGGEHKASTRSGTSCATSWNGPSASSNIGVGSPPATTRHARN